MVEVFMSYHVASAKAVVKKIGAELDKRGISYWYSETGVYGGEDFALVIPPKIRECKVFLWILDQGAAESKHVRRELALADKIKGVTIIPLCLESIALNPRSEWTEYYLSNIQKMDGKTPPLDKRIEELVDRIEEILTVGQAKERIRQETEERKARHRKRIILRIWSAVLLIAFCALMMYGLHQVFSSETNKNATPIEANRESEISALWVRKTLSAGNDYTVALRKDGTVVAVGNNNFGKCDLSDWCDIATVSARENHTIGLRKDGTVVAVGSNAFGQCDLSDWRDITSVVAGEFHTVGLRKNGTVVAGGSNAYGQCEVSDWQDIAAVSAGYRHTVGLRKDGTVVAVGLNSYGQCEVSDWQDIAAVSAGTYHTVGLRKDGTVMAVGWNAYGQCDVSEWQGIEAVSAGDSHTVGLRKDGAVVAVGWNGYGRCDVSDWRNIVAVSAGGYHTVGLCANGGVIAVGSNEYGQCDVSEWSNIQLPW